MSEPTSPPLLRIVRGQPSDEELAALVTVVLAARTGGATTAPPSVSAWAAPERRLRRPLRAGPGAWRAAARRIER